MWLYDNIFSKCQEPCLGDSVESGSVLGACVSHNDEAAAGV